MLVIFVTPCLTVTHLDSAESCNRERVHPIFSDLFSRLARRLFPPQPMANATRERVWESIQTHQAVGEIISALVNAELPARLCRTPRSFYPVFFDFVRSES